MNQLQQKIWTKQNQYFEPAIIDINATISETTSECMEGIGLSYKGEWGYAPIIVTLANTRKHLCLINRSGNTHSAKDAAEILKLSNL